MNLKRALLCLGLAAASGGCGLGFSIRHHYLHMRQERHAHTEQGKPVAADQTKPAPRDP